MKHTLVQLRQVVVVQKSAVNKGSYQIKFKTILSCVSDSAVILQVTNINSVIGMNNKERQIN